MTETEKYYKKWSENCRIFIDYKPIHSHEDMLKFAEDYHQEQVKKLNIDDVSEQRELLIDFCGTKEAKQIQEFTVTVRDGVDKYLKNN